MNTITAVFELFYLYPRRFWFFKVLILVGIAIGAFFIKGTAGSQFGTGNHDANMQYNYFNFTQALCCQASE